jgi:hypothetical protein
MMNPVLQKATDHFRARLDGDLNEYYVSAWDCKIYFKSVNSFREESRILNLHQQGKVTEALVESLIVKCRDDQGKAMFRPADRQVLLNEVDPAIIIEIAGVINEGVEQYSMDVDETVKN